MSPPTHQMCKGLQDPLILITSNSLGDLRGIIDKPMPANLLPTRKTPNPDNLTDDGNQIVKEKKLTILHGLPQKVNETIPLAHSMNLAFLRYTNQENM